MKPWLKYGLIGLIIFVIIYILLVIINTPNLNIPEDFFRPFMFTDSLSFINYVFLFGSFILGALIGFIVSKIKKDGK